MADLDRQIIPNRGEACEQRPIDEPCFEHMAKHGSVQGKMASSLRRDADRCQALFVRGQNAGKRTQPREQELTHRVRV